jgi:hypothetical protein
VPKVPQVFSSGDSGGTPGGARLNPEGFANLATGGLRAGAHEINKAAQDYQQIYTTLRTEAEKLEAEQALGEAQRQFADADVALKSDPNMTAEQYPQEVARQIKTIREGVGKSLQYRGARMMFERGVEHFATQQTIKAKYEGVEMLNGQVRATTDLVLRDDVNQAVNGPTKEIQDEALNRAMGRIAGLTNRRIYSGSESATKTATVLSQVEQGRIRRDAANPVLAPAIVANLRKGNVYTALSPEAQHDLANNIESEARTTEERFKKERKDAETAVAEEAEKGIQDSVSAGNWNAARGFLTSARKFLPATRYEHWATTIATREGQGAPSVPEVKKALLRDVYSIKADPSEELRSATSVRDRIDLAYRDNQLDDKDYATLQGHANTRITKSQDQKLTALGREHAQAEQMISEALRVNGPAAAILDTQAQALKTMALEDLTRNSSYIGQGSESPLAWYARRRVFYQSQLSTVANQRLANIDTELRSRGAAVNVPLTDAQALIRARPSFRNEADYYDAVRLFKEATSLREEMARLKGAPTTPASTGGGGQGNPNPAAAKPTPAGGNTLGR